MDMMKDKKAKRQKTISGAQMAKMTSVYLLLIAGAVMFLFPFLWMILTAIKPIKQMMDLNASQFIITEPQFDNFIKCLNYQSFNFFHYARNTLYLCLLVVCGTVLSSSFVAYGFSRIKWRGRDALFFLTMTTMMIPFPVIMIPLYSVFKAYGWIGTFKPLWVPAFFGSAFNIFLIRQFFLGIPHDLTEAAHVDGASDLRIYFQIVLPLAKPALLVVALFSFMYTWNDFLAPLIYLPSQDTFTLAVGLHFFEGKHGGTEWNLLMAASTLVILPVLILYFFTQKTFIEGISLTGLKG